MKLPVACHRPCECAAAAECSKMVQKGLNYGKMRNTAALVGVAGAFAVTAVASAGVTLPLVSAGFAVGAATGANVSVAHDHWPRKTVKGEKVFWCAQCKHEPEAHVVTKMAAQWKEVSLMELGSKMSFGERGSEWEQRTREDWQKSIRKVVATSTAELKQCREFVIQVG